LIKPATMKSNVLLFGSTGILGQFVFWELIQKGYSVTVVVRDKVKAVELFSYWANIHYLENENISSLTNELYSKHDIVISLLGNRISHAYSIDETGGMEFFDANNVILEKSLQNGVKKFGVVAPFHDNNLNKLSYFRNHQLFQKKIISSGIDFLIINSTLLFSSLTRQIKQAEKGKNMVIGEGKAKVNPIFDGDVAALLVQNLATVKATFNCGGPEVFSRLEIAEKLQKFISEDFKIKKISPMSIPTILPYLKFRNPIMHERMAYFYFVNRHDFIATPMGSLTLMNYLSNQLGKKLKSYENMSLLPRPLSIQ
jgi:uncharacterized protein YbjT (DUF2867 family)